MKESCTYNTTLSAITTAYYIETDHLGSIVRIYDFYGDTKFSATYDAWGNQTINTNAKTPILTRGYCGHEHWNIFGLIDMNGRFYAPLLGRFLSPDPYVQMPENPQNFNRYSYCLNNPLKYTDPTGNITEFVAFLIFSTISNGLWQGVEASAKDQNFWSGFGKGAAIGAASSVAGGYAGQYASSAGFIGGFTGGFAGGFTGGFIAGYGNALINNSSNPLMQGIYGGLASGAIGGLAGGLNAGGYARENGGDYWTGNGMICEMTSTSSSSSTYDPNISEETNNAHLKMRIREKYGVGESDLKIKQITTNPGDKYTPPDNIRFY